MPKLLIYIFLLSCCTCTSLAQTDTIEIRRYMLLATRYRQDGEKIRTMKQLTAALQRDAEATKILKHSKRIRAFGAPFVFAGAVVMGYEIAQSIINKQPLTLSFTGCAIALVAVPFNIIANKQVKHAVKVYNQDRQVAAIPPHKTECFIAFSGNAVGIVVRF